MDDNGRFLVFKPQDADELDSIEVKLLLEGIYLHYGFDFREYSYPSVHRRVWKMVKREGLPTITALLAKILHDPECMERFLLTISINVTSMFRDPAFYLALRTQVVPLLRTYPFIRIWHAGCSTGEEAYSMAILLKEEGVYDRCRIYATDVNEAVLRLAKTGSFPLQHMKLYTSNYLTAGGKDSFSSYYTVEGSRAVLDPSLAKNMVFAKHNLAMDGSFNEFNLVLCRNVMIYFDRTLQAKVFSLLHESLAHLGVLALGIRETLALSDHKTTYETVDPDQRLYRRVA